MNALSSGFHAILNRAFRIVATIVPEAKMSEALHGWLKSDARGLAARRSFGFTLVEILVTIAIIGVLLALVLPIAGKAIGSARAFKCRMSVRSAAYDFAVFKDDQLHGSRGRDEGLNTFHLDTFVASQYCLEEFWCWDDEDRHELPDADQHDPLRCPLVKGSLVLRSNMPCQNGGVNPTQNVSYTFNMRLRVADSGAALTLSSRSLDEPNVPLIWDVDAEAAVARSRAPFFSAPTVGSNGIYRLDRYWFPSLRHNGTLNVGFVDGHVGSSNSPLTEPDWKWNYVPAH